MSSQNSKIADLKNQFPDTATTNNNVYLNPTAQLPVNMPTNIAIQPPNLATTIVQPGDHKFNLVIYGISEYPSGTSQPDRLKHDMEKSVSAKVNEDIIADSVSDCITLGSYKKELNHPCPILLKLNQANRCDFYAFKLGCQSR